MIPISVDPKKSNQAGGLKEARPRTLAEAAQHWRQAGKSKKKDGLGKATQGLGG